jgi:hypothetical protein
MRILLHTNKLNHSMRILLHKNTTLNNKHTLQSLLNPHKKKREWENEGETMPEGEWRWDNARRREWERKVRRSRKASLGGGAASREATLHDKESETRERKEGAWRGGIFIELEGSPWDPIWAIGSPRPHPRLTSLAGSHPAMCQHLIGDGGYPRLLGCTPGA